MNKKVLLLVTLVAILAFWQIYKLYFGYEDFALFYMLQHRAESLAEIAKQPNFSIYRHHFWLIPWQFKLFGYHPLPYYLVSVLTYIAAVFTLYWFVKKLASEKAALVAAVVFASGYFGLETIWWNAINGHQTYLVIILLVVSTGLLIDFTKTGNRRDYLLALIIYTINVLAFTFRAFLMVVPPLVSLAIFRRPLRKTIAEFMPFLAIFLVGTFQAAGGGITTVSHSSTSPFWPVVKAALSNIGSSLLPLYLVVPEKVVDWLFPLGGLAAILFLAYLAQHFKPLKWAVGYLVLTAASVSVAAFLGGSPIIIYENYSRFVTPIFLGTSIIIGLLYELFNKQKYAAAIIGVFVVLNVGLANYYLATKSGRHHELRQFYTQIKRTLPKLPEKAVLQFTFLRPSAGPFVSGYVVPPEAYLAGFYGKHVNDLKISRSFDETLTYLKQHNLDENNLFFFNYDRGAIEDLSSKLSDILRTGQAHGQPSFAPAVVELDVEASFKLVETACPVDPKLIQTLAFQRETFKGATIKTVAMLDDHKPEYLFDGDYDNPWTVRDWVNTVFFEIELAKPVSIGDVRWPKLPGRRTGRMPTAYQLDFKKGNETKTITMTINKTIDGRTPQIDELDIFPEPISDQDYKRFVEFKRQPLGCFPTDESRAQLINSVDSNVAVPIRWLTDGDQTFRPERTIQITVPADGKTHHVRQPLNFGKQAARDHEITKLEPGTPNLPTDVTVTNITLDYPTLSELRSGE